MTLPGKETESTLKWILVLPPVDISEWSKWVVIKADYPKSKGQGYDRLLWQSILSLEKLSQSSHSGTLPKAMPPPYPGSQWETSGFVLTKIQDSMKTSPGYWWEMLHANGRVVPKLRGLETQGSHSWDASFSGWPTAGNRTAIIRVGVLFRSHIPGSDRGLANLAHRCSPGPAI